MVENIRAREDPQFSQFLLELGNGELQHENNGLVRLPDNCCIPFEDNRDTLKELVAASFPEILQPAFEPTLFTNRAILTSKNDDVNSIYKVLID